MPRPHQDRRQRPSRDPSIEHEPHLSELDAPPPSSEDGGQIGHEPALAAAPVPAPTDVDHSVWDEPSLVAGQADGGETPPEGALTYRRWLDEGIARTGWGWSWLVTLGVAASAGAWGIIGAFTAASGGGEVTFFGVLGATVLAPVTEEITKVAALLWVVEKRPFWLKSIAQVLLCSAAGGLVFAAIENLIYLNVYHPQGGEAFAQWRWTVCTGLHVNCSVIAGFGLVRIWDKAVRTRTRPELRLGMPMFALAMITHGLYNFAVTVAEAGGWLAFE